MGHTTDHHHCSLAGANNLYLGVGLPVLIGVLTLQSPSSSAFTLISEPQAVGLGLLNDPDERHLTGTHFSLMIHKNIYSLCLSLDADLIHLHYVVVSTVLILLLHNMIIDRIQVKHNIIFTLLLFLQNRFFTSSIY